MFPNNSFVIYLVKADTKSSKKISTFLEENSYQLYIKQ